jgi:selenocysteine lyase/cysteine desulfurase
VSYKRHFTRFLRAEKERLHFAAHSHHLWPDVSFEAQERVWLDAARLADQKWDRVFREILPAAQGHIARELNLSDPETLAFAPNTHEFLVRILSCFEERDPVRILTTDGEFHSFRRQSRRWEEAGRVRVERVPVEPFANFPERFLTRVRAGEHDLVFVSHVFFSSGFVVERLSEIVQAVPSDSTYVVIDGYHGFMAVPTNLAPIEARAFYLAGGYKYAMAGEGVCFLHCPSGYAERPVNTGWFAGFGELEGEGGSRVSYGADGVRMFGATFDPSGLYRLNAVMQLWQDLGVTVSDIHAHVRRLQTRFLERLEKLRLESLPIDRLIPDPSFAERGHFLTFRVADAGELRRRLQENRIITDHRGDRLRFGFGIYHNEEDVDGLCGRLEELLS